jgi:hypothetical protein
MTNPADRNLPRAADSITNELINTEELCGDIVCFVPFSSPAGTVWSTVAWTAALTACLLRGLEEITYS